MVTYQYDNLNQLIREDNKYLNQTIVYNYDGVGNIVSKQLYPYTEGELTGTPDQTIEYAYGDNEWKDLLTAYDGEDIEYDKIGNPTSYLGNTLSWQGRQLSSLSNDNLNASYTYDANGLRVSKTVNGVKTYYQYSGDKLLYQEAGNQKLFFWYDAFGDLCKIYFVNGSSAAAYFVTCNSRGDIEALYNASGNLAAKYVYDSWGNTISVTDANGKAITSKNHIGNVNPIRYRGYYFDAETGFYYLQSRYYNPTVGRFLNADIYCDTGTGLLGTNMFAYCENNPVMYKDNDGFELTWATIFDIIATCLIIDNLFPEYRVEIIGSNSLPLRGKPNSNQTLYNRDGTLKQKRWFGADGYAVRDRDYSHPGDMSFPHDHTWENGKRSKEHLPPSPDYEINWEPIIGSLLLVVCIIGIIVIALNDVTGVGVFDDFLIAPLTFGIERGSSLIFA